MLRTHIVSTLTIGAFVFGCSGDDPVTPGPTFDPIEFQTTDLPSGQQGEVYEAELTATGGSGEDVRWTVVGSLPPGLFMSSAGEVLEDGTLRTTILGTPTSNGDFTFSVRITDSEADAVTAEFGIQIAGAPPPLEITTEDLPDGGTGQAYTAQLEAENGQGALRWALVSGALPAGVTLSEDGSLSGTPMAAGPASFTVRVQDEQNQRAEASYTVDIQDLSLPLELVTTDVPDGEVGLAYTAEFEAANGAMGYTWRIIGDAPPGLEITPEGNPAVLSGTPTDRGQYTFQVQVEDADGDSVARTFFIEVVPAPPPVRIITIEIPGGEVNTPYETEIEATNGSGMGYQWAVSGGQLPPGLTLAPMGTPATTLSGNPTAAGTFEFTVRVTDTRGESHEASFRTTINAEIFPIEIVATSSSGGSGSPVALPNTRLGESYSTTLTAQNGFGSYNWVVTDGSLPAGLDLQIPGTPDTTISGIAGERGTFTATITVFDDNNETASEVFTIFVDGPEFVVNVTTQSVNDARACNSVNIPIEAQQGSRVDYQWQIVGGALPPGLTLDPTGTPATRIRGTVPAGNTGTYNFTVEVTDSAGDSDTASYSMDVIDDGTGARWVAAAGDIFTSSRNRIAVSPICQPTPGPAVEIGVGTTGNVDTGSLDFALSPDGTMVAFIGDHRTSGHDDVWIADISGNPPFTAVRVSPDAPTSTAQDAFDLKWAPDSNHLIFMGDLDVSSRNELYVVDTSGALATGSAIPIVPAPPSYSDVDSQDYNISPDGRWVVYSNDTGGAGSRFEGWIYDLDTNTPRSAVRFTPNLPGTSADFNFPMVWSPDGTSFIYNCDCDVQLRDEIYLVDVTQAGFPTRTVSHAYTSGNAQWTSSTAIPPYFGYTGDGNYVFYRSDGGNTSQGDSVFFTDIRSPTARGQLAHPRPSSSSLGVFYIRPAGASGVVVMGDMEVSSLNELYYFDLATISTPESLASAKVSGTMQPSGDISSYTDFEVAPDGSYVVFTADKVVEGHEAAFLVDLANPFVEPPQISPESVTSSGQDVFNIYWPQASNRVALYGDVLVSSVNEVFVVDVTTGAPYNFVRMNAPISGSQDINSPIVWRDDGGGLFYEGDVEVVFEDELNWSSVDNPGVTVNLSNVVTNGDVFYIKGQGE